MNMQLGWGWKIGLLYTAFAGMIIALVVASSRQKFDLVSKDYYKEEIAYQQVLDASANQAALQGTMVIRANEQTVNIEFPAEFQTAPIHGTVHFYSAVSKDLDRTFDITTEQNRMTIDRNKLPRAAYTMKVSYNANGKDYYQQSDINLAQ